MSKRQSFYRHEARTITSDPENTPLAKWVLRLENPVIEPTPGIEVPGITKKDSQQGPITLDFKVRRWTVLADEDGQDGAEEEDSELDFEIEDDAEEFGTDVKEPQKPIEEDAPEEAPQPAKKVSLFSSEVPPVMKKAKKLDPADQVAEARAASPADDAPTQQPDMEVHHVTDISMGDAQVQDVDPVGREDEPILAPVHDLPATDIEMTDPLNEAADFAADAAIEESAPSLSGPIPGSISAPEAVPAARMVPAESAGVEELVTTELASPTPIFAKVTSTATQELPSETDIVGVPATESFPALTASDPTPVAPADVIGVEGEPIDAAPRATIPEALSEIIPQQQEEPVNRTPTPPTEAQNP